MISGGCAASVAAIPLVGDLSSSIIVLGRTKPPVAAAAGPPPAVLPPKRPRVALLRPPARLRRDTLRPGDLTDPEANVASMLPCGARTRVYLSVWRRTDAHACHTHHCATDRLVQSLLWPCDTTSQVLGPSEPHDATQAPLTWRCAAMWVRAAVRDLMGLSLPDAWLAPRLRPLRAGRWMLGNTDWRPLLPRTSAGAHRAAQRTIAPRKLRCCALHAEPLQRWARVLPVENLFAGPGAKKWSARIVFWCRRCR